MSSGQVKIFHKVQTAVVGTQFVKETGSLYTDVRRRRVMSVLELELNFVLRFIGVQKRRNAPMG